MMRSTRWTITLVGLAALVGTACSGGTPAVEEAAGSATSESTTDEADSTAPETTDGSSDTAEGGDAALDEVTTVKVGVIPGSQELALETMIGEGFAEAYNLDLELQSFQNPPAVNTAIAEQTVDVGFSGPSTLALMRSQGRGTFIFNALTGPSNVVVTRPDSDIESLADLEGKKLGSFGGPASTTYGITAVIAKEKYGLDLANDLELVTAPNPALVGLLDKGEIDAALLGSSASLQATLDGYKIVSDIANEWEDIFGGVPAHVVATSHDGYAEGNEDVLIALSAALRDALEFIQTDEEIWETVAAERELDSPDAPAILEERVGDRYVTKWDEEQVEIETALIEEVAAVVGEDAFGEVPEGLFRTDLLPKS